MAEGGGRKVTPSVYKGSEEVFDFTCDPCSRLGNNSEAVDFCSDCSEYFCNACTTHHLNFGITSGHNVVKRDQAKQAGHGKSSSGSLPTERCKDHNGELITTYCAEHDAVACNTCVSMDHRSCDRVYYIPSMSCDPNTRLSISQVRQEMSGSIDAINSSRRCLQQHKTIADDDKAKHIKHIKDRTQRLTKHAYAMEKASANDVSRLHKKTTDTIATKLASLDKAEETMKNRLKRLDKADTTNDSQVFVETKLGSKEAKSAGELTQRLKSTSMGVSRSTFAVNDKIDIVLSDVNSIGQVILQTPYRAILNGTYDIGMKADKCESDIVDICELSDGNIVMTDFNNICIKTLNKSYKTIKHFKTTFKPWGICQTSQHEIVVTLPAKKILQFIDIKGSWKMTTSFPVKDHCRGVFHKGDELFVSCGGPKEGSGQIVVYDMSGSLRRKFQFDCDGQQIFSRPRHIAVTNGNKIHISDETRGVISIDQHGNIDSVFSENLEFPLGLCPMEHDNVIVCGKMSNNLLQINTEGEFVAICLSQEDGIERPKAAVFSRSKTTLTVALENSSEIKVFQLTQ